MFGTWLSSIPSTYCFSRDPFRVSVSDNQWHCFQCDRGGGNALDFVAQKEDVDIRGAALMIQEWFLKGSEPTAAAEGPTPPEPVRINPPLTPPGFPLRNLDSSHRR